MPNIKFTSLSADGELLAGDKIPFVDISDNAMGETGTNKIISASSLSNSVATLMSANRLNGTKIVDGSLSSVKLSTGGPVWDTSGNFSIGTSSSSSTLITSIGKGRTSPGTSELHLFSTVSNTANATIVREDSDNGDLSVSNTGTGNVILSQTGSGALIFSTAGSERVKIVPEGRVGIGKSNPATALDVVGTITAGSYSGDATLSGTPTAPTATAGTNTTRIATTEFVQTAISDSVKTSGAQTIAGIKTFSSTIVGSITGNSGTTDALKTAISAALTGDVTGTASNITGSSNISIPTAIGAGVIDNSKVSTNAAIDGTKITPNFGNKNIVTTGTLDVGSTSLGGTFLKRVNTSAEGGDLSFAKAIDNTVGFAIDCFGNTSSPDLRFISGSTVKAKMTQGGNLGLGGDFSASSPLEVRASTTDNSPINNGIRVFNAGTASTNNAVLAVHTSGANGGDPLVSWDINGVDGFCAGIDNSDSDKFKIASNFSDLAVDTRITIQQDGNVGIGTTSPAHKLDILDSAGTANFALRVKTDGVANDSGIWSNSNNDISFDARNRFTDLTVSIKSFGDSFLTGGNLGLGTSIPTSILHTRGVANVAKFESSTNDANIQIITNEGVNNRVEVTNRPGGRMALWNNTSGDVVNILQNGNVGIGKPDPSTRLDVNGTVTATAFVGNVTGNVTGSSGSCTGNSATVTNGVYTTGNQTIGGTKSFSSAILLSNDGFRFSSDGLVDTGISWNSDGVMNVICNAAVIGQFNSTGWTGNVTGRITTSELSTNGNQINPGSNGELALTYQAANGSTNVFYNTTIFNGKQSPSAKFFGDTKTFESYGPCRSITNSQTHWSNAGLESRSDNGNALVALHSYGASAALLKHVRGGSGLEIRNGDDTAYAPLAASEFFGRNVAKAWLSATHVGYNPTIRTSYGGTWTITRSANNIPNQPIQTGAWLYHNNNINQNSCVVVSAGGNGADSVELLSIFDNGIELWFRGLNNNAQDKPANVCITVFNS